MRIVLEPTPAVGSTPVGERILTAASRLFYEHGINATGVDRIVEEAGTTKRTLYQRFGSKDALVAAYLQRRAHQWQTELLTALAGLSDDPSPEAVLEVVYEQAQRWASHGRRGCAFVNAWAEIGATDHHAVAVIRTEKTWMMNLFTQLAGDRRRGAVAYLLYEGAQVAATIQQDSTAFTTASLASAALLTP